MSCARLSARVTASSTYAMVNSSSARTSRRHRTVNVFPRKLCAQLGAHAWFIAAALEKDADAVRPRLVVAQRVAVEREPRDQLRDRERGFLGVKV